jgi:SNF2 family DNA or RNA helicase
MATVLTHFDETKWIGQICPFYQWDNQITDCERKIPISGLQFQLYPYQALGVHWLLEQERSVYRGGILGDETGFGKV